MDSSAFNGWTPPEVKFLILMVFVLAVVAFGLVNVKSVTLTLTEEETVIQGCRGVCTNSDAYDPDMLIVQSCDTILKHYNGRGCFWK